MRRHGNLLRIFYDNNRSVRGLLVRRQCTLYAPQFGCSKLFSRCPVQRTREKMVIIIFQLVRKRYRQPQHWYPIRFHSDSSILDRYRLSCSKLKNLHFAVKTSTSCTRTPIEAIIENNFAVSLRVPANIAAPR
jgi:hypothetical protein